MSAPIRHRAAVIGSPIEHSLSPALHRAAYAQLGLDWQYDAIDVDERGLSAFLSGLDASWAGVSVTMPLKERIIRFLGEVDELAGQVRSVNTVLPGTDGAWRGVNTDVPGMVRALREAGAPARPSVGTVLGAGATARSAVAALAALGVRTVTVHARQREAADTVADLARRLGMAGRATDLQPDLQAFEVAVVISTLPGDAAAPWLKFAPRARATLLDVTYHPWPSALAASWGTESVASGRDLLLWQAVEQVRLMTGREPDPAIMAAALPR